MPTDPLEAVLFGDRVTAMLDLLLVRRVHQAQTAWPSDHLQAALVNSPARVEGDRNPRSRRARELGVSDASLVLVNTFLERMMQASDDILDKLDREEAIRLGQLAADQVIAGARWSQLVGERVDTSYVCELLGRTRQALAKRQKAGSLIGLPGQGTTWYPVWQFDIQSATIRPEVSDIVGIFRKAIGESVDPYLIAAWATRKQDEDLGMSPAAWLNAGKDVAQLLSAARRAAERLAQ